MSPDFFDDGQGCGGVGRICARRNLDLAFDELNGRKDEGCEGTGDGPGHPEGGKREGVVAFVEAGGKERFASHPLPEKE